ncbi:MAG TPA: LysR family transcriptional regulator [Alcanivoracaceae bacterium]|nr:LysR family transcriptional regulator [Alcanivoracaceae bacterium]
MDIQALEAFIAVSDTGSFSTAATRLFITQPAVSKRIATLEQQLEAKLFDRIGRQIVLTEAGRTLLPRAQQLISDMEDMRRAIDNLSGEVSGTLRIGSSHHIGLHRLPPVLKAYARRYPKVELDLSFVDSEAAWQQVLKGELELGLLTLPPVPDPRLLHKVIWPDPLEFIAAHDHPLAQHKNITLEQLTEYDALLPGANTFTRHIVEELFAERQLSLSVSLATNYLETLYMMVSVGLGWSVLPVTLKDPTTTSLATQTPLPKRYLGVVYHPERSLSNSAQQFLQVLQEHASD